ncbi:hypothetical protein [Enterococcus italicus]|uniref:hypothetical protein n=1 Tax=Enterococcus italicus TaxID=246144 RepID=UPI003F473861
MSEFKSLDDVIGYLTNVAEFELRHTEHIKIPDGHMTVISENYNIMFDAIQWITEKLEQPPLNENQQIVLDELKDEYEFYGNYQLAIYWVIADGNVPNLNINDFIQVLQIFSQWDLEQEKNR